MAPDSLLTRMVKWVFATPWALCLFLALIGTIGVALTLQGSPAFSLAKVFSGTVFGLAVGGAYIVDSKKDWSSRAKRVINGLIGLLAGGAVAFLLGFGGVGLIAAAVIGFVLGVTAKEWIYHVSLI
jgi:pilus assembly protein TadC